MSRQLVGEQAFGASGYRYCGNILAAAGDAQFARDEPLLDAACALAAAVAEAFDLVGVNGVDFVARDGVPAAIEVNPRWSASMELVERAYGLPVFGVHAAACASGALPAFALRRARRGAGASGKAVVFARRDVTIGDTRGWIGDPTVRDVPHPGEGIRAGRPVCTVFAQGRDSAACHAALVLRADRVYAELAAWEREIA
jgi:predicted ATP-grasp superfamily ATP-dependent carboligase